MTATPFLLIKSTAFDEKRHLGAAADLGARFQSVLQAARRQRPAQTGMVFSAALEGLAGIWYALYAEALMRAAGDGSLYSDEECQEMAAIVDRKLALLSAAMPKGAPAV